MKNIILLLFLVVETSCSSLYQFTIEVQEPAPVTLSTDIAAMLVVNNSVAQPNDIGVSRTFRGVEVKGMELQLDSVAWIMAASLVSGLRESHFFDHVYCFTKPVRTDVNWMYAEPLPESFKQDVFETQGFDGVVSIDRVLFQWAELVHDNGYIDAQGDVSVTVSIYLYNRKNPLTAFSVSDSLFYKAITVSETVNIFKDLPEYMIGEMAYRLGKKLTERLVPFWTERNRILYSGYKSRMQEALSFAKAGKWDKAEMLWLSEYAVQSKLGNKGKTAHNIAVANEMQDRLDTALQWAITALEHLKVIIDSNILEEINTADHYVDDLQKRIKNDRLLNLQWGTDDPVLP